MRKAEKLSAILFLEEEQKMNNIIIRPIITSESDIHRIIKYIYQTEEFPGGSLKECALWTKQRIENGYYIQIAETDGNIIGFVV